MAAIAAAPTIDRDASPGRRRIALAWLAIAAAVVVVWEGSKAVGIASDLALPHIWTVFAAFVLPAQRSGPPLGLILAGQTLFTFRETLIGFAVGGVLGLLLGVGLVHSRLA